MKGRGGEGREVKQVSKQRQASLDTHLIPNTESPDVFCLCCDEPPASRNNRLFKAARPSATHIHTHSYIHTLMHTHITLNTLEANAGSGKRVRHHNEKTGVHCNWCTEESDVALY